MPDKYICECGDVIGEHAFVECSIPEHCHVRSFCLKCGCTGYVRAESTLTLDDLIEANDASTLITAEDLAIVINAK